MTVKAMLQGMQQMTELHKQLIELADLKKRLIIDNQVEQLQQEVKRESEIIYSISELEQHIRNLAQQWMAIQTGTDAGKAAWTVNDVIRQIPASNEKTEMQDAALQLKEAVAILQEKNELNKMLVMQSLDYIQLSLDLILTPDDSQFFYSSHPDQNETGSSSLRKRNFDTKA